MNQTYTPTTPEAALQHEQDGIAIAGTMLVNACHGAAYRAGWWFDKATDLDTRRIISTPDGPVEKLMAKALVGQKLALIHSEVSEGMEGVRKNLMDDKLPHRTMLEVELADAVIRICDLCGAMGLDLGGAIAEKLAYNAIRPDHKPEAREAVGGKSF